MEEMKTLSFRDAGALRKWLDENHSSSRGIWLRISKKASGTPSVTYAEALEEAICYGWIDGQKRKCDARSWLQMFTPRRSGSGWSKRNTGHAMRLIQEGRMMPSGLREVEAAKRDGRWERAYEPQGTAPIPEDFMEALGKNKKAMETFRKLDRKNLYPISYRLQTAKRPETREKRKKAILGMLAKGKRFHP